LWNNPYNELGRKKISALHLNIFKEENKNYCMKETYKAKAGKSNIVPEPLAVSLCDPKIPKTVLVNLGNKLNLGRMIFHQY